MLHQLLWSNTVYKWEYLSFVSTIIVIIIIIIYTTMLCH